MRYRCLREWPTLLETTLQTTPMNKVRLGKPTYHTGYRAEPEMLASDVYKAKIGIRMPVLAILENNLLASRL